MKRTRKIILIVAGILGAMVLALAVLLLCVDDPVIGYHNRCLRQAITGKTVVDIKCKALVRPGYTPRRVKITDRDTIAWLLSRLRIKRSLLVTTYEHACGGHLAITIRTAKGEYSLSYDHGQGIYPIAREGENPGFIDLDPKVCSELNAYFQSLGYTRVELGLP